MVRLIDDNHGASRLVVQQPDDVFLGSHRAGRVVGVHDVVGARRGMRLQHGLHVVRIGGGQGHGELRCLHRVGGAEALLVARVSIDQRLVGADVRHQRQVQRAARSGEQGRVATLQAIDLVERHDGLLALFTVVATAEGSSRTNRRERRLRRSQRVLVGADDDRVGRDLPHVAHVGHTATAAHLRCRCTRLLKRRERWK